jgi:hypothetical protein
MYETVSSLRGLGEESVQYFISGTVYTLLSAVVFSLLLLHRDSSYSSPSLLVGVLRASIPTQIL